VHGVLTWLKNFGYWDVAKYMLETPMGSPRTISSVVYSRRAWGTMSDADKKIAIEAVPMHLARMVYLVNVQADERLKEQAIKEKHVTFDEGGQDFKDFMAKFRQKETVEIPKIDSEKLGVKNADEIFKTFLKNLDKWEKLAKEQDLKHNMDKMAAVYKKEIYDKIDPNKL
jgi:TRAP-type C4-dicarboxylate transport system substrate-binding protein